MRSQFTRRAAGIICLSLLTQPYFAFSTAGSNILRPIRVGQPDTSIHLGPRDSNAYSALDLQTQGHLVYGNPIGLSSNLLN